MLLLELKALVILLTILLLSLLTFVHVAFDRVKVDGVSIVLEFYFQIRKRNT